MNEQREALASILNAHHPTRGMRVSMGVTCDCGYWTGSEPEQGKRPLPWGQDQLDLHRADVVLTMLADAEQRGAARVTAAVESAFDPGELDCGRLGFTCREAFSTEPERWCRACRLRAALTPAADEDPA